MKVFRCVALASVVLLASSKLLLAASLSLGGNSIVWNPIVDSTPSAKISVAIFNSTVGPDPDLMGGWILTLAIQPVAATGTLQFNSETLPAGANYVFNGAATQGLMGTFTNSSVFAFDGVTAAPFGVNVPAAGKFLLDVNFKTPDNALGTFNLVAIPGAAVTQWSDADGNDREFTNLLWDAQSPLILGTITIVPEPSSMMMVGIALCALGSYSWRRRKKLAA